MKRKLGFTLLELLAVILILGIIALIAVPTVNDIVEDSKKKTLKLSAEALVKATEQNCRDQQAEKLTITNLYQIENGQLEEDLDVNTLPESGKIALDDQCNADLAIVDNGYCAVKEGDTITVNQNLYDCTLDHVVVPETKKECFIFDSNTRTITGYNFDDTTCPTAISIPEKINGVPVEHIGDFAFVKEYSEVLWAIHRDDASAFVWDTPVSYQSLGYTEPERVMPITKRKDGATKLCYSSITYEYENQPWEFTFDPTAYRFCSIANSSFEISENPITAVDFSNAKNLRTIGNGAFINNKIEYIYFGGLVNLIKIGVSAFQNNLLDGNINMEGLSLLSEISSSIFAENKIVSISFPKNINKICTNAFSSNSLEEVEIPNTVTVIDSFAFACNFLTSINTNNVNYIGSSAFFGNSALASLTTNTEIIDKYAFQKTALTTYNLGNRLREIGNFAFSYNEIIIPNTIVFPNSLRRIGFGVFDNLTDNVGVKKVTLNEGLEIIEEGAFYDNAISTIVIPKTVKVIGESAFQSNYLSKVTFKSETIEIDGVEQTIGIEEIGILAFSDNKLTSISLPNSIKNLGGGAFVRNNVSDGTEFVNAIKDGIVDNTTLNSYAGTRSNTREVTVPSNYTTIGEYAFWNVLVKSVTLQEGTRYIEDNAFMYMYSSKSRKTVHNIPTSVETIGPNAFLCDDKDYCKYNTINIKNVENAIAGAKWGNSYATVNWLGPDPVTSSE